jgi:hypothetical protein
MASPIKVPKFVYGVPPASLILTLPAVSLATDRDTVGGQSESGAGVPENYIIRKRSYLAQTIRVWETELLALIAFLDWCMDNGSQGFYSFYPDTTLATNYTCYLTKPKPGARYNIKRNADLARVYDVEVEHRTVAGDLFDVRM